MNEWIHNIIYFRFNAYWKVCAQTIHLQFIKHTQSTAQHGACFPPQLRYTFGIQLQAIAAWRKVVTIASITTTIHFEKWRDSNNNNTTTADFIRHLSQSLHQVDFYFFISTIAAVFIVAFCLLLPQNFDEKKKKTSEKKRKNETKKNCIAHESMSYCLCKTQLIIRNFRCN